MTGKEFSDGFDTILNSYGPLYGGVTVVLDEYEKSYYLTTAQKELVVELYTGRNATGESLESTEELRRYLAVLVKESNPSIVVTSNNSPLGVESSTSKFFTLPEDVWFITYEKIHTDSNSCGNAQDINVTPVTQDEYNRIRKNPFRGVSNGRALRLDLSDGVVEILCKHTIATNGYYIRYIRKPGPIILIDLPDGLTIDGEDKATDYNNTENGTHTACELHEALHNRILQRAVMLALQSKGYNITKDSK